MTTKADPPDPTSPDDAAPLIGALLRNNLVALCLVRDGWLTYGNDAFAQVFGLSLPLAVRPFVDLAIDEDRLGVGERLATIADGRSAVPQFGFRGGLPDGGIRDVEFFATAARGQDGVTIVGMVVDLTERQRAQSRLSSLAFVDALTGLPNRARFMDRLRDAFVGAQSSGASFALLIADLDGFKEANDRCGHEGGDRVLQVVAKRLRAAARANDTVARLGGDEFALILPSIGTPEHAALVAGRLIRSIDEPIGLSGNAVSIGASVGVALHPLHGATMDALMHAADAAMYGAKRDGKNRFALAGAAGGAADAVPLRFVEWTPSASIGVELLDQQHRRLVELINALGEDLKAIRSRTELLATLNQLVDYARFHFDTEERLLDEHAAEQLERHRQSHRRLLDDVRSLASGVDEQSMALTMRYLQDWLFVHIDSADRSLGEALNARGVR